MDSFVSMDNKILNFGARILEKLIDVESPEWINYPFMTGQPGGAIHRFKDVHPDRVRGDFCCLVGNRSLSTCR